MGSSSSKTKNHATYNINSARPQYAHKDDYLHSCVNDPSALKNSHSPLNLSKSTTNKPSKQSICCPTIDHKDTTDVQLNFVKDISFTKEEYNLKSQKIYTENKIATHVPTVLSLKMLTKHDFTKLWFSWKNEFLTYMNIIDQAGNNKNKWGIMLLNRLGPIGQEIYRTFKFDDDQTNDDINILLEKFDQYCTFGGKKRTKDEDIDVYINSLKVIASKYAINVDEAVKKKILEEIDAEKFTNNAKILIPTFSFSSDIKSFTLQEVMCIWMRYENVSFKQREKINNYSVKNCSKCSLNHTISRCPAYGKQCNKCGNMNHHQSRCPSQCIENCSYCGECHFYRECPAYTNECSKCHKVNHFSWKCGSPKILNCNRCGFSHIASTSACLARDIICNVCGKRGHISRKCKRRN